MLALLATANVGSGAIAQQAPVVVDAEVVELAGRTEALSAVGELMANEAVTIRPQIDGRIREIHFNEGSHIEQGALLFTLEDELYRAQLDEATATLNLAAANSSRASVLASSKAGTERSRDEAIAQLRVAEARKAIAEKNLSDTRIHAPFSGELGLRKVSVGAYISKGDDLVDLIQTDPLKVTFQLPERVLRHLSVGQPVEVQVDALPGERFAGKVTVISPQVSAAGRSLQLRAEIDNREGRLRPGLFARVNLVISERDQAMFVAETALIPRGNDQFVFRVVDGKAVETKVRIGQRRAGKVEILEGLEPSDIVVTGGQMKLRNGAPVEVTGIVAPSPIGASREEGRSSAAERS